MRNSGGEKKKKTWRKKINDVTVYNKRHRIASRCILYYIILYSRRRRRFFATTINLSTVRLLCVHILLLYIYIVTAKAAVPGKQPILVSSFFYFVFLIYPTEKNQFDFPNTKHRGYKIKRYI